MPRLSRGVVATLAAALTYLFWFEYLPPFNRIHLHSDIEGYHWPLLVAALEAIRHGRFPLWDASIYCGIPFSGNIQAALFYPRYLRVEQRSAPCPLSGLRYGSENGNNLEIRRSGFGAVVNGRIPA